MTHRLSHQAPQLRPLTILVDKCLNDRLRDARWRSIFPHADTPPCKRASTPSASGCLARLKDAPKKTTPEGCLGPSWFSDSAQTYPVGLTGRRTATAGLPQDLLVFPWGELSRVWGEPARLGVIPWGEPAKLLIKNLLSSNSLVG
jgi:hypothetical protein